MSETIVMGPEVLVLCKEDFPITFATISAIEVYKQAIKEAEDKYNKDVSSASYNMKTAEEAALDSLKEKLK